MTITRPSLIARLKAKFNNPKSGYKYSECRDKTAKAIKNEFYTRAFDDYPPLLKSKDLEFLETRYLDILIRLPENSVDADHKIVGQEDIKYDIDCLISDIARIGSDELFDYKDASYKRVPSTLFNATPDIVFYNLALNPALCEYLHLDPSLKDYAVEITIAYLSVVMADLQNRSVEHLATYAKAHAAFNEYLNANKRLLVKRAMTRPNSSIDLCDVAAENRKIRRYYMEHKLEGVAAVGGILAFGALGAAGYFFYKTAQAIHTAYDELKEEQNDERYSQTL